MKPIFVPRTQREKDMQRALLQWREPKNHPLIRQALRQCGREDLIGYGHNALVPPAHSDKGTNTPRNPRPKNLRKPSK